MLEMLLACILDLRISSTGDQTFIHNASVFPSYSILPKWLCREGGCRSRNPHPNAIVLNHSIGLYRPLPNAKEAASLPHITMTIKHAAGMGFIGVAVIDI
jgi:hypothetical protein